MDDNNLNARFDRVENMLFSLGASIAPKEQAENPFAGSGTADFDNELSAAAKAKWELMRDGGASAAEVLAAEVDYLRKHAEAQKKRS